MSRRGTQLDRALAALYAEREVLDLAIKKLEAQQQRDTKVRKGPRPAPTKESA